MKIVIDANAAACYTLKSHHSKKIRENIISADYIFSPDLFISEISNVYWQHYNFQKMPIQICEESLEDSISLVNEFLNSFDMYKEAFSLAKITSHPVYDCLYLVSSRRLDIPLLTLDKKLINLANQQSIKVIDIYNS